MKKKKRIGILEKTLDIVSPDKDKCKFESLLYEGDPAKVKSLINKYEKLASKLSGSGDYELEKILSKISKLKSILSKIYKKNQQKLINEHLEKINKDNGGLLEVMSKHLIDIKKKINSRIKNIFEIKE